MRLTSILKDIMLFFIFLDPNHALLLIALPVSNIALYEIATVAHILALSSSLLKCNEL